MRFGRGDLSEVCFALSEIGVEGAGGGGGGGSVLQNGVRRWLEVGHACEGHG